MAPWAQHPARSRRASLRDGTRSDAKRERCAAEKRRCLLPFPPAERIGGLCLKPSGCQIVPCADGSGPCSRVPTR
jgi:hypothetical protein